MLKKAGILVALTATGLLATSPMAFADVTNNCASAQGGTTITQTLTGGSSFLGVGGAVVNILAPVNAPVQALNCTNVNVSDLVKNNSNNTTVSQTRTRIVNSFNTRFGRGFPFN